MLAEDLCKLDHIWRVQLLGEVHHDIGIVLLITWACTSEKRIESVDGDLIALRASSSCILLQYVSTPLETQEMIVCLTQAASHSLVESEITWAMRLWRCAGAAVTDPAAARAKRRVDS